MAYGRSFEGGGALPSKGAPPSKKAAFFCEGGGVNPLNILEGVKDAASN